MPDDHPLSMPVSAPLVSDQGKGREAYAKRKREKKEHPGFAAEGAEDGKEGGVEGEGGRVRRTHTVPMPKVATLAELNAYFARCDAKDDHRRVGQRVTTVGDDFAVEQPLLRALPTEPFETGISLRPRVDRHARVTVRQCQYSVPVRYVGRQVRVLLRATQVLVFDGPRLVAEHERSTIRGSVTLTKVDADYPDNKLTGAVFEVYRSGGITVTTKGKTTW